MKRYLIVVEKTGTGYSAYSPDLDGCVATGKTGDWELYDMAKDRSEQHNLAGAKAETMKTMAAKWKQIDEGFVRQRESAKPTTKRRMPVAG